MQFIDRVNHGNEFRSRWCRRRVLGLSGGCSCVSAGLQFVIANVVTIVRGTRRLGKDWRESGWQRNFTVSLVTQGGPVTCISWSRVSCTTDMWRTFQIFYRCFISWRFFRWHFRIRVVSLHGLSSPSSIPNTWQCFGTCTCFHPQMKRWEWVFCQVFISELL